MKVLNPNLSSVTDYMYDPDGTMSAQGIEALAASLFTRSSGTGGIGSISLSTADAKVTKSIRLVRASDGHVFHECHFDHKKLAKTHAKILNLNFVIVPGSSITTVKTAQQKRAFTTYECRVGENALSVDAKIEIKVRGKTGCIPGTVSIGSDSITFSGMGPLELEFPVNIETVPSDPVATAKQAVEDACTLYFGSSLTSLYGSDPWADVPNWGVNMATNILPSNYGGGTYSNGDVASCMASTFDPITPTPIYANIAIALGGGLPAYNANGCAA